MQMAKQMGAIWLGARVMNGLVSGNFHTEAPLVSFGKNDKGEETIYSIRTLPTDLIHVISEPRIHGRRQPSDRLSHRRRPYRMRCLRAARSAGLR